MMHKTLTFLSTSLQVGAVMVLCAACAEADGTDDYVGGGGGGGAGGGVAGTAAGGGITGGSAGLGGAAGASTAGAAGSVGGAVDGHAGAGGSGAAGTTGGGGDSGGVGGSGGGAGGDNAAGTDNTAGAESEGGAAGMDADDDSMADDDMADDDMADDDMADDDMADDDSAGGAPMDGDDDEVGGAAGMEGDDDGDDDDTGGEFTLPTGENSIAYTGCSMAWNIGNGYKRVGGKVMWNSDNYQTSAMVVQNWTDPNSASWNLFDQKMASIGGKDTVKAIMIQICIFSSRATDQELRAMISSARQHVNPDTHIFMVGQPVYEAGHDCSLAGPGGAQWTDDQAKALAEDPSVNDNLTYLGQFLLNSGAGEVSSDSCHASSSGEDALGRQAMEYFGG